MVLDNLNVSEQSNNPLNNDSGFCYGVNSFVESNVKKIWDILVLEHIIDETQRKELINEQELFIKKWINISFWDLLMKKNFAPERKYMLMALKKNWIKLNIWERLFLKWYITEEQLDNAIFQKAQLKIKNKNVSLANMLVFLKYIDKNVLEWFIENESNKVELKDYILKYNILTIQELSEILWDNIELTDNDILNILFKNKKINAEQLYDLVDEYWDHINY